MYKYRCWKLSWLGCWGRGYRDEQSRGRPIDPREGPRQGRPSCLVSVLVVGWREMVQCTHTSFFSIVSTSLCSPSAIRITSSIRPPPICCSTDSTLFDKIDQYGRLGCFCMSSSTHCSRVSLGSASILGILAFSALISLEKAAPWCAFSAASLGPSGSAF